MHGFTRCVGRTASMHAQSINQVGISQVNPVSFHGIEYQHSYIGKSNKDKGPSSYKYSLSSLERRLLYPPHIFCN